MNEFFVQEGKVLEKLRQDGYRYVNTVSNQTEEVENLVRSYGVHNLVWEGTTSAKFSIQFLE